MGKRWEKEFVEEIGTMEKKLTGKLVTRNPPFYSQFIPVNSLTNPIPSSVTLHLLLLLPSSLP